MHQTDQITQITSRMRTVFWTTIVYKYHDPDLSDGFLEMAKFQNFFWRKKDFLQIEGFYQSLIEYREGHRGCKS